MKLHPDNGYYGTHLWLPKKHVNNLRGIKAALKFEISGGDHIDAWEDAGEHIRVPREFIPGEEYEALGFPVIDLRPPELPALGKQVGLLSTLRDERQEIGFRHLTEGSGVLSLACGAGKTVVSLHAWAALQTPGLFVTHTLDLMEQWRSSILAHTTLTEDDIGTIAGTKQDWRKPICLASIQTLAARAAVGALPEGLAEHFGLMCWDEVHHLAAPSFSLTAGLIDGVRWGLSATDEREDGNDPLYKYHLGPVLYKNLDQDLIPWSGFVHTGADPSPAAWRLIRGPNGVDWNKLCEWLAKKELRNRLIESYVDLAMEQERNILVLSRRVDHVELLHSRHKGPAGLIHNGVPAKARASQLRDHRIVFATANLAREGLDRPDLDTVFIILPVRQKGWIQQILGRMQRKVEGTDKAPRLYVFEDEKIPTSRNACSELRSYLTNNAYPFEVIRAGAQPAD